MKAANRAGARALAALVIGIGTSSSVYGVATTGKGGGPALERVTDNASPGSPTATSLPSWTIQPGGRLAFEVEGVSESFRGTFSKWTAEVKMDPENVKGAEIQVTVDLASASLGDATMDQNLQSADFFRTSLFPKATWRSTAISRTGPGSYSADGTLSLKGASKPQSLAFTLSGAGERRSVTGSAKLNRTEFGVGEGSSAGGLDKAVSLTFSFEAVSQVR